MSANISILVTGIGFISSYSCVALAQAGPLSVVSQFKLLGSPRPRLYRLSTPPSIAKRDLAPLLACPVCRAGDLNVTADQMSCQGCGVSYPVRHGISVMYPPEQGSCL